MVSWGSERIDTNRRSQIQCDITHACPPDLRARHKEMVRHQDGQDLLVCPIGDHKKTGDILSLAMRWGPSVAGFFQNHGTPRWPEPWAPHWDAVETVVVSHARPAGQQGDDGVSGGSIG